MDDSMRYVTGMTDDNSIMNLIAGVPGKKPMTREQIVNKVISGDFKPPRSRLYSTHEEKVTYINGYISFAIANGYLDEA